MEQIDQVKMYNKLSKKELIRLLIMSNEYIELIKYPVKWSYVEMHDDCNNGVIKSKQTI